MGKKVISNRKKLAAVFASFTIIIMGTVSLLQSMAIDYYSVLGTLLKIIPASFALGCLGWVMGMILDKPKKSGRIAYNHALLDQLMKNDLNTATEISNIGEITDISNTNTGNSEENKETSD